MMNLRAYIFMDVAHGAASDVLRMLKGKPSIASVDCVEGPPDVIVVVEAEEPQRLAEVAVNALTSVAHLTNSVQCSPVCGAMPTI
jgi:hypothetical protein